MTRAPDHPWIRRSLAPARPLVFAHRGGSALAPENTIAAFDHAHALGVDGFELDVRLSRDGEVVVIHDAEVDRTTDGTGRVSRSTADQLRCLDAGFRFTDAAGGRAFPFRGSGVRIPLLRELLARFPDELLIIELKGGDPELARCAFDVVLDAGALDRVCFGGFQRGILAHIRRLGNAQVCSSASREETRWALYRSWVHVPWPWIGYNAFQVPETAGRTRVVSPQFLRAAHASQLAVQVWTVNEEADMRRLLGWGVDGLITDRPDLAVRVRDEFLRGRNGHGDGHSDER